MAQGGKSFSFNFNIDNGLPSNHVYYCLKDKFGYLWLATENGVVKYNGYDFKVFNLSSGLSNADVWFLLEDKKGRIWLSSISDEIGYLYNDEYHKPYFKALKTTIYPGSLSIFGSGVAFESKYVGDNGGDGLCVEQNDTIVVKQTLESLFDDIKPTDDYHNFIFPIVRGNGHLNIVKNRFIYDYNVQSKVLKQTVLLSDTSFLFKMGTGVSTFAENYTISGLVSLKPDNFSTLDIRTGVVNKVSLPLIGDRKIQSMFPARIGGPKNHFFVNTIDKALLYSADTSVRLVTSWDIKDLAGNSGVDGSKISNMLIDSFWGRAICSPSLGFFLAQKEENKFERDEKTDLKNFKFVGGASSGGGFWWN